MRILLLIISVFMMHHNVNAMYKTIEELFPNKNIGYHGYNKSKDFDKIVRCQFSDEDIETKIKTEPLNSELNGASTVANDVNASVLEERVVEDTLCSEQGIEEDQVMRPCHAMEISKLDKQEVKVEVPKVKKEKSTKKEKEKSRGVCKTLKRFHCKIDDCNKKFTHSSNLSRHKNRTHHKKNKYHCSRCAERVFFSSGDLQDHIYWHDGKPHVCSACKKSFLRPHLLKKHQRREKHF
jgi:hypothetical protein